MSPAVKTTLPAQAARVANYLEQNPASTRKEIDAACCIGCVSKVLADMPGLGYGLAKGWRREPCAGAGRMRLVRTYTLLYRPRMSLLVRMVARLEAAVLQRLQDRINTGQTPPAVQPQPGLAGASFRKPSGVQA